MNDTRLSSLVDRVVADSPDGTTAPAGVAVASNAAGTIVTAVTGWRDAEHTTPLGTSTSHDLASVTKVVTTACLMSLVSSDAVRLDDEVRRFLPAAIAGITVRDLLLHRGGLWEWYPLYAAVPDRSHGSHLSDGSHLDAVHRFVDTLPLRYRPGEAYHYSDLGFIQLGRVVAVATGASLPDAVAELLARPLGLGSLQYGGPVDDDVATSALDDRVERTMLDTGEPFPVPFHSSDFAGWRTAPVTGTVNDGNAFHALGGVSGHAGLFATVGDLAALGVALASADDHDRLWAPPVVAEFFRPGPDAGQSLGFRRYDVPGTGVTVLGHTGFVGTGIGFVPGRGVAVAMAGNRLVTPGAPVSSVDLWRAVVADTLTSTIAGSSRTFENRDG